MHAGIQEMFLVNFRRQKSEYSKQTATDKAPISILGSLKPSVNEMLFSCAQIGRHQ
jgi:hypothetical protein